MCGSRRCRSATRTAGPTPTRAPLTILVPTHNPGAPLVTPTPDRPHTLPTPRKAADQYVVVAGDTLGSIAAANGISVDALERANNLSGGSVLNIGQERHARERVRVPERKVSRGERGRGKVLRRIVIVDEVFPEEGVAEENLPEKEDQHKREGGDRMPQAKRRGAARGVSLALADGGTHRPRRRTHDARTLSTVMYCMQLFGHSGE